MELYFRSGGRCIVDLRRKKKNEGNADYGIAYGDGAAEMLLGDRHRPEAVADISRHAPYERTVSRAYAPPPCR